jgi:UDP-N-acetylglucosamine 1-carboxyvinyltransferase
MSNDYLLVKQSLALTGQINLSGAKNATLPIMAALILTNGKSQLTNVPNSADVIQMIKLLQDLGAEIIFSPEKNYLEVDTSKINNFEVKPEIMNQMRASILVMGPLLARFGKAKVAMPGGCLIGARPINLHLKGFQDMGVEIKEDIPFFDAHLSNNFSNKENKIILEYPSVGATENIAVLASLQNGKTTTIINAALEPEVLDFLNVLKEMGAQIEIQPPATIKICGVNRLFSVKHKIIPDRLEAGALLLSSAITGGNINIESAQAEHMDVFLEKLKEMGHEIKTENGIRLNATKNPKAVNFKTGPYPGFPTDLQAPMMTAQCLANGKSIIEETVFENRLMHAIELQKMGAQIKTNGTKAIINGVEELYGTEVIATDIRASCALVLAGLAAKGETKIMGMHHWQRGYDQLEEKLKKLGANVFIKN